MGSEGKQITTEYLKVFPDVKEIGRLKFSVILYNWCQDGIKQLLVSVLWSIWRFIDLRANIDREGKTKVCYDPKAHTIYSDANWKQKIVC